VRIPFPERIPIEYVAVFAVALFAVQTIEDTLKARLHPRSARTSCKCGERVAPRVNVSGLQTNGKHPPTSF